jgi:hypothetical protein
VGRAAGAGQLLGDLQLNESGADGGRVGQDKFAAEGSDAEEIAATQNAHGIVVGRSELEIDFE